MNTSLTKNSPKNSLIAVAVACALLSACSAVSTKPEGAEHLRSRLTQLQSDPRLGNQAPLAMKEADIAVTNAERPEKDKAISTHLIFMADRKIEVAKAQAEGSYAVAERSALTEQREAMRLQSRTLEADAANARAAAANVNANNQLLAADLARSQTVIAQADADAARDATANAQRNSMELQNQINDLQAKVTDRGLVLTLGDVLFASGTATLNRGGDNHLAKLAAFLNKYPERTALIEGYTDSIGSEDYNQGLSERRANAVKSYLTYRGISAARITSTGKGESSPVGSNDTATGRQQNRRVEVIIANDLVAAR